MNIGWYLASAIWPEVRTVDRVYIFAEPQARQNRRGQPCAPRDISRAKYQPIFTNARWILYLYLKSAKRKLLVDVRALRALETAMLVQWSVAAEQTWSIFFQLHSSTRRHLRWKVRGFLSEWSRFKFALRRSLCNFTSFFLLKIEDLENSKSFRSKGWLFTPNNNCSAASYSLFSSKLFTV